MNEKNDRDELFRHRLSTVLQQLNGQSNGFDSSASIENELARIEAEPLDEAEVSRIMSQVQHSMVEAASSRQEFDAMENRTSPQIAAQPSDRQVPRTGINRQAGNSAVAALVTASLFLLTAFGLFQGSRQVTRGNRSADPGRSLVDETESRRRSSHQFRYVALPRPQSDTPDRLAVGQTLRTAARERRQVLLPDGSVLYLNEQSTIALTANRTVSLHRGQLFVEVTPASAAGQQPFIVETPDRSVTALGTKFAVSTGDQDTEVLVTQGRVRISGSEDLVTGGQVATAKEKEADVTIDASPRASQALSWTRELIAAAEPPLIPQNEHEGGSLVVVDPSGQETKLSLRKFHVDAHLEDGFARTTIDQTYFNHTHARQQGTFKFPLPPDASLSRLAMYVNGKLMEGGMVERDHGRNVFEQIMHTKRDPALLEWVDGTTFRMRVFPLEPRQEKRIVLSYTQRLSNDYDRTEYRFPAGHSFERVHDWSARLTVANGAGKTRWFSPTHLLESTEDDGDLVLEGDLQNAVLNKDLVVELTPAGLKHDRLSREIRETASFCSTVHDGYRYQMLRFRPELKGDRERPRRNWVFLYESSGDRNPLLARVQLDVIRTLLEHAEHEDSFSVISAATKSIAFRTRPVRCSRKNISKAVAWLEDRHLVGALDLEKAFSRCRPFCRSSEETVFVHVGSATPVLGERNRKRLLRLLPSDVEYVGVGVGKRWSRSFMKSAAGQTGGYFTQINPDENVNWRSFDLLSTLNAPRLIDVKVDSGRKGGRFLTFAETVAHGQEIAAITRLPRNASPLDSVTVSGLLNGKPFRRTLRVENVNEQAEYLPRNWTRLEIDRLVASGAEKNKASVIALSKSMYVMSPFTSLLVLEDEAMYEQFNVDRGRKDHWALYPAPDTIQVVHEPGPVEPDVNDPVEVLEQRLTRLRARREIAQSSLDRGVRDGRTAEEIERLRFQVESQQRAVDQAENRLQFVAKAKNSKLRKTIDSVRRLGVSLGIKRTFVNFWGLQPGSRLTEWGDENGDGVFDMNSNGTFHDPVLTGRLQRYLSPGITTFTSGTSGSGGEYLFFSNDGSRLGAGFHSQHFSPSNVRFPRQTHWYFQEPRLLGGFQSQPTGAPIGLPSFRNANQDIDLFFGESSDAIASMSAFIDPGSLPRVGQVGQERRQQGLQSRLDGLPEIRQRLRNQRGIIVRTDEARNDLDFVTDLSAEISGRFDKPDRLYDQYLDPFGRVSAIDGIRNIRQSLVYETERSHPVDFALDDILQFHIAQSDNETVDELLWRKRSRPEVAPLEGFEFRALRGDSDRLVTRLRSAQHGFEGVYSPSGEPLRVSIRRPGVLRNMLTYAPGMQTSTADLLAVVDAECSESSRHGTIDPDALRLIEKCRQHGWEEIGLPCEIDGTVTTAVCNGAGAFRLERRTVDGLLEQIVADEQNLQHLYPELGIGAKRSISRFHRRSLLRLTPWLLPPAEELSFNCDLQLVNDRTIRIIRSRTSDSEDSGREETAESLGSKKELVIELEFDDDGRLVERRLIEITGQPQLAERLLIRHVYEASGRIRMIDGDGRLVREINLQRRAIEMPPELPETEGLVILPLPYRAADSYSLALPAQPASSGSVDYSQLSESDAIKLIATHVANSDFDALWNVINQRFVSMNDCRMGFAVLLSGAATGNSQPVHEVASCNQGSSALGSFLVQHLDWWTEQDLNKEFVLPESASPFLKNLVETHNLFALWASGRATQDRTEAQVNNELNRAFRLIRQCRSKLVAWFLLNVVQQSIEETDSNTKLHLRLANEVAQFEDIPGFEDRARFTRALWLIPAGKPDRAIRLYRRFREQATEAGRTPAVSAEFRSAFVAAGGSSSAWSEMIMESSRPLVEQHRSLELLELAFQCAVLAEHDTAIQLLNQGIADVDLNEHPELLVAGLQCLMVSENWTRAEDFIRQLINCRDAHEYAALWRTASKIAAQLGDDDESLRRLEHAMRLEFSSLPETINVAAFRTSYSRLFDRLRRFAESTLSERRPLPNDFVQRVTWAADAWRSIDPDPVLACHRAAELLQLIGLYDHAWDYWTTSLVDTADGADAWKRLAVALAETGQVHRASLAWDEAFAAEPTNAELLWNHAVLLREHQQPKRAKKILTQIVNGQWQPRFESLKSRARRLLQQL